MARFNFDLQVERNGGRARVAVRGELDLGTAARLERCLAELLERREPVLLDLRELTFMDSTGLCALLKAREQAQAHRLGAGDGAPARSGADHAAPERRRAPAAVRGAGRMTPALELELPGDNGAPAMARRAVEERVDHGCDEEQTGTLLLLVTELVTNAVLHAGAPGSPVLLRVTISPGSLRVEVHDRGPGFEMREPEAARQQRRLRALPGRADVRPVGRAPQQDHLCLVRARPVRSLSGSPG